MLKLSQFDYQLPDSAIAQTPAEPRDASKLLVLDRVSGEIKHSHYYDLADFLRPGDLLVRNNSKVINARLKGLKTSGGKVEILLNSEVSHTAETTTWECLTHPGLKVGQEVVIGDQLRGRCVGFGDDGYTRLIEFACSPVEFFALIEELGEVPLPPYIAQMSTPEIAAKYQTLYAQHRGSVAAPTAGLHFTPKLDEKLRNKGIEIAEVTLHVGLGTFLPVKSDDVTEHTMHAESYVLDEETVEKIRTAKAEGRRVIAVGTTTTRVLESVAAAHDGDIFADAGSTDIYIYPPYQFRCINGLITNFHLPKSTLLMLVSAFVSAPNTEHNFESFLHSSVGKAYLVALQNKYRFFSFGDGMLII